MPFDWTQTEEGAIIGAPQMNSDFADIEAEINDLPQSSIQPRSLSYNHLPSQASVAATHSMGTNIHRYENVYPGWTSDILVNLASYSRTGWVIIGQDLLGTATSNLSVSHSSFTVSSSSAYIVLANISFNDLDSPSNRSASTSPYNLANTTRAYAVFKIQVGLSDGTWKSLPTTERYSSSDTNDGVSSNGQGTNDNGKYFVPPKKDIAIREMVTSSLIGAGSQVVGARVLVSVGGYYAGHAIDYTQVQLQHCTLSVLGLNGLKV